MKFLKVSITTLLLLSLNAFGVGVDRYIDSKYSDMDTIFTGIDGGVYTIGGRFDWSNLGVLNLGTTAPTQTQGQASRLYLQGTSSTVSELTLGSNTGGDGFSILYNPTSGVTAMATNGANPTSASSINLNSTSQQVYMRGSLAIGTTSSPDDSLHIANANARIVFEDDSETDKKWEIGTGYATGDFSLFDRSNTAIRWTVNGTSGVTTFNQGIQLPTSGGTATTLNYYEELTHATNFTLSGTSQTTGTQNLLLVRNGKMVTMCAPALTLTGAAGASTQIDSNTDLPTRFRPSTTILLAGTRVINGGTTAADVGLIAIESSGNIALLRTFDNPALSWSTAGTDGFQNAHCVSWHVN